MYRDDETDPPETWDIPANAADLYARRYDGPMFRIGGTSTGDYRHVDLKPADDDDEDDASNDPSPIYHTSFARDFFEVFVTELLAYYASLRIFTFHELLVMRVTLHRGTSLDEAAREIGCRKQALMSCIDGKRLPDGRVWGGIRKKGARIFLWLYHDLHGRA